MIRDDHVVSYECPIAEKEHDVPGADVRILKIGDGGFVVACDCGPESLADADSKPHPTVDHLVNIFAADPSPEQWLQLERAADGWHDTTAWNSPDGYEGTNGQRRARFRKRVEEIADTDPGRGFESTTEDRKARKVRCPDCDAAPGQKCQRPSGHRVHSAHSDRVETAVEEGIIDGGDGEATNRTQASITAFGPESA